MGLRSTLGSVDPRYRWVEGSGDHGIRPRRRRCRCGCGAGVAVEVGAAKDRVGKDPKRRGVFYSAAKQKSMFRRSARRGVKYFLHYRI